MAWFWILSGYVPENWAKLAKNGPKMAKTLAKCLGNYRAILLSAYLTKKGKN